MLGQYWTRRSGGIGAPKRVPEIWSGILRLLKACPAPKIWRQKWGGGGVSDPGCGSVVLGGRVQGFRV
eukprot:3931596-Rhodomonas_salina.5